MEEEESKESTGELPVALHGDSYSGRHGHFRGLADPMHCRHLRR